MATKKRNDLGALQVHALVSALKDLKIELRDERRSVEDLAKLVEERVKFKVTPGNIYSTGKQLGFEYTSVRNRKPPGSPPAQVPPVPPSVAAQPPSLFDTAVDHKPTSPLEAMGRTNLAKSLIESVEGAHARITHTAESLFSYMDKIKEKNESLESRVEAGCNAREQFHKRLEQLEADSASLRQLVVKIYQEFGVPIPA